MSGFPPDLFVGRRLAVVGLGRLGLPAARALAAMGADVVVWDDNPAAREAALGIAPTEAGDQARKADQKLMVRDLRGGALDVEAIILSPGIYHRGTKAHPIAVRAAAEDVPILTDAEYLFQAVRAAGSQARFAGITGTNGKSTTTALLAHILDTAGIPVAAGANLGTAALALPLLPDHGVYVLEMSSYMLERLATLRFDAAVMLNLTPDHLDRHGDMAGYARAKAAIFARQDAGDLAVIGIDDEWPTRALTASGSLARIVTVSGSRPATGSRKSGEATPSAGMAGGHSPTTNGSGPLPADQVQADGVILLDGMGPSPTDHVWADGAILRDGTGPLIDLRECPTLPGTHNAQNAAAAAAMALFLGVDRTTIATAMRTYPGLPHRQQLVATVDGIAFINDSKATNADSTARALECHDRVIWIAGGEAKEGGIETLVEYFPRIAHTLLIGRDAPILAATLAAHHAPHETVGTLQAAVPAALAAARRLGAKVVLLSPACASWDQFTGFDQRGDHFASFARALAGGA